MLVPLSWLKEYVDVDVTPDELEKKLFDAGFEVEEKYELGRDVSNIVVGLIESCEPIPDTHLHVCQVNAGAHGTMLWCRQCLYRWKVPVSPSRRNRLCNRKGS